MDIIIEILKMLLSAGIGGTAVGWYFKPKVLKRKEEAEADQGVEEARNKAWDRWERQLNWLDERVQELEQSQDALVAHVDDLYAAIGTQPAEVQVAIKAQLSTERPGARIRKRKPAPTATG